MRNTPDFVAYVVELIRPAPAVAKAMFGGHGLYVDGLFVAIVVDDVLYLKCDAKRALPDEALESPAEMRRWLRLARAAALAQGKRKTKKAASVRA